MQPPWVTKEDPKEHKEVPALNTQGEDNKAAAVASNSRKINGVHIMISKAELWTYSINELAFLFDVPTGILREIFKDQVTSIGFIKHTFVYSSTCRVLALLLALVATKMTPIELVYLNKLNIFVHIFILFL